MTPARLETAMCVVSPRLIQETDMGNHMFEPGTVQRQDYESAAGAARTMVYRVIAALNGFDVVNHAAPRDGAVAEPPVLISRDAFGRLRQAIMNETVFTALADVIGESDANALLGEIAAF